MDTNNKTLITISKGGGLLSQFIVVLDYFFNHPTLKLEEDIYLDKGPGLERLVVKYLGEPVENFYKIPNWWDSVLKQTLESYSNQIEVNQVFTGVENFFTDKNGLEKLSFFKSFMSSHFTFHPELISLVNNWEKKLQIGKNTLAVHLRLTDLNDTHSHEYGKCTLKDYLNVVQIALDENPLINKIFVASESNFNLQNFKNQLNIPVVFVPTLTRTSFKDENYNQFYKEQVEFLKQPNYSREVFLDLMLLAKCRILVGRISAVTNTSIILNEQLQKYYCVNQLK